MSPEQEGRGETNAAPLVFLPLALARLGLVSSWHSVYAALRSTMLVVYVYSSINAPGFSFRNLGLSFRDVRDPCCVTERSGYDNAGSY